MDIYLTALALGGVGLVGMAVSGMGRHGHSGHAGHSGHDGPIGHSGGHAPHAGGGHTGHAAAQANNNASQAYDTHSHDAASGAGSHLMALLSPRVWFSLALGLGTAGLVLNGVVAEPLRFIAALGAGILFERLLVTPLWNFAFKFASNPAATLEGSVMDEATAVTSFDRNGQGLIAVQVDGQMVQLLGTLQAGDREMKVRVPAGSRLRIQDVDAARNRCTVSLI